MIPASGFTARWPDGGIEPHSEEWNAEIAEQVAAQRKAMSPRLYPKIPPHRYLCFYPMDRKRGEAKNFYTVPIAERGRMMREHGLVGRRYSDSVQQIISGSMGFDDWEWGVDLLLRRPPRFQEADLRDAVRRSQRGLCALRVVLHRPSLSCNAPSGLA